MKKRRKRRDEWLPPRKGDLISSLVFLTPSRLFVPPHQKRRKNQSHKRYFFFEKKSDFLDVKIQLSSQGRLVYSPDLLKQETRLSLPSFPASFPGKNAPTRPGRRLGETVRLWPPNSRRVVAPGRSLDESWVAKASPSPRRLPVRRRIFSGKAGWKRR